VPFLTVFFFGDFAHWDITKTSPEENHLLPLGLSLG